MTPALSEVSMRKIERRLCQRFFCPRQLCSRGSLARCPQYAKRRGVMSPDEASARRPVHHGPRRGLQFSLRAARNPTRRLKNKLAVCSDSAVLSAEQHELRNLELCRSRRQAGGRSCVHGWTTRRLHDFVHCQWLSRQGVLEHLRAVRWPNTLCHVHTHLGLQSAPLLPQCSHMVAVADEFQAWCPHIKTRRGQPIDHHTIPQRERNW